MRIFLDDMDYRLFMFVFGEVIEEYDLECWSYCVMPNHYHATLRPTRPNLSDAIRCLNSKYAQTWNRRHQRVGHVFQGRFKDQIVQDNAYLAALSRYLPLNPVRAKLVERPEDWPWSSYAAISGLKEPPAFLAVDSTLRQFGDGDSEILRARFAEFVTGAAADDEPYERLRSNERIIGDRAFKTSVRARGLQVTTRKLIHPPTPKLLQPEAL